MKSSKKSKLSVENNYESRRNSLLSGTELYAQYESNTKTKYGAVAGELFKNLLKFLIFLFKTDFFDQQILQLFGDCLPTFQPTAQFMA